MGLAPAQALPRLLSRLKTMWLLQTLLPHLPRQRLFRHPKSSILLPQCQTQVQHSRLSLQLRPTLNESAAFTSLANGGHPSVAAIFMSGGLPC